MRLGVAICTVILLLLPILLVTVVALAPRSAFAAFPGVNGKIAFVSIRDDNFEIYVMNDDGTGQTRLTTDPNFDLDPKWSPDGSKIVFWRGGGVQDEVFVMNADGTGQTNVSNDPSTDDYAPAWSPDGTKIVFIKGTGVACADVFVMNADGTGQTNLSNDAFCDNNPAWSPDGTKIAFESDRGLGGDNEIIVMNADGSGQVDISNNPVGDFGPDWSPDGAKIVFDRNGQIVVMNSDGSGQNTIVTPFADSHPAWSPDGTKIVYERNDLIGDNEVFVMNADGTGQVDISNNPALDQDPNWGPLQQLRPSPVGGVILGIDMTALLVAGAAANAGWIIPIAGVSTAGIVGFALRKRIR